MHLNLVQRKNQPVEEQSPESIMRQNAMKDHTYLNIIMIPECTLEYIQDSLELTQNTLNMAECTLDLEERRREEEMPSAQNIGADMDESNIIESCTCSCQAAYMAALVCTQNILVYSAAFAAGTALLHLHQDNMSPHRQLEGVAEASLPYRFYHSCV